MIDATHSTKYRFYIQRYDLNGMKGPVVDIESEFNCLYQSMTGNNQKAVKNVYEEDFAEASGVNILLPETSDIAYQASDMSLCLLFKSNEDYKVLEDEERFLEYITAQKFEYHDTFRPNRYWQLTFISEPNTKGEILHGGQQYRWVEFPMRNWGGGYYKTSQL